MIKAVTFDLFDTLVPAAHFGRQLDRALYEFTCRNVCPVDFEKFREIQKRQQAKRFERVSTTLEEVVFNDRFRTLFEELIGQAPSETLVEDAGAVTCSAIADSINVPSYIPPLLEKLSVDYKLALISNFPISAPIYKGLERNGIINHFQVVMVSSDFGLIKPHPSIFQETAKKLGVETSEMVHVGDDWACDVLGAANAGSSPVFTTQFVDEEMIRMSGRPEMMRLLSSHLDVTLQPGDVPELRDIRDLPELLLGMRN